MLGKQSLQASLHINKNCAYFVKVDVDRDKREEEIYNFTTNLEERKEIMAVTVKSIRVIPIDFSLENSDLEIINAYGWEDARRAVFKIRWDKTSENIFIVWDLEHNVELNNYSLNEDCAYIYGRSSRNGYILSSNIYIDLDNGVLNPYFDYYFYFDSDEIIGYHINAKGKLFTLF